MKGISLYDGKLIRLTDDQAMPLVMLASMTVSQKVLAQLSANSATGVMGNWVRARSMGVLKGVDYGRTGRVEKIKADVVKELLDEGYIPILPNLGWNKLGQIYHVNSNEVASALCASTLEVAKFLEGKTIVKIVAVPKRMVNFVIR